MSFDEISCVLVALIWGFTNQLIKKHTPVMRRVCEKNYLFLNFFQFFRIKPPPDRHQPTQSTQVAA